MYTGGISGGPPNASDMGARMSKMFAKDDADKSGGLSLKEFLAASEVRKAKDSEGFSAKEMFKKMDLDKNNQITKEEMMAPASSHGKLSSDTMSSLLAAQEVAA